MAWEDAHKGRPRRAISGQRSAVTDPSYVTSYTAVGSWMSCDRGAAKRMAVKQMRDMAEGHEKALKLLKDSEDKRLDKEKDDWFSRFHDKWMNN